MKRVLFQLLLITVSVSAFAQKSYIHIYANRLQFDDWQVMQVTGDLPSGIKNEYDYKDNMVIGKLLNLLSKQGFEVEFMSPPFTADGEKSAKMCYLLSKRIPKDEEISNHIGKTNDASIVKETAQNNNFQSESIKLK